MLGDPLSLFDNLGTGVVQFFSQTRAEVAGDSRTRGEGFKRLARAVAGGAAGSASKLTGSLADILGAVSFHDDREHLHMDALNCFGSLQPSTHLSSYFSADGDALPIRNITPNYSSTHQTHPKIAHRSTFMSGVRQSRDIMVDTVVAGLSGLVDEPIRGLQDDGVIGVAKGVAKGIVKAVASPLVGVLGAVSVLTESVEMSTRYQNGAPVGRRNIGGPSAI